MGCGLGCRMGLGCGLRSACGLAHAQGQPWQLTFTLTLVQYQGQGWG